MIFARSQMIRASLRAVGALTRRPVQQVGRRTYAAAVEVKRPSDVPWMLASVGLGVPAAFYLVQSGPSTPPHRHHGEQRLTQKEKERLEAEAKMQMVGTDVKPSDIDEPASRKPPAGLNTMSYKQEGITGADTANPFVTRPGLSVKGEGETESVRIKGSVPVERRQV